MMKSSDMTIMTALVSLIVLALASMAEGGVLFTNLTKTLVVTSQIESTNSPAGVAKAGVDHLKVVWSLNSSFAGMDSMYKNVDLKLCFGPPSQVGRGWRKTSPDLSVDKTCTPADIGMQKYTAAGNTTVWLVAKKVPKALYFVRAYALNAEGAQVAFGQTTNKNKTTNLFSVQPITGRHTSIDIAAAIFSVFAVGALLSFLGVEALLSRRRASK